MNYSARLTALLGVSVALVQMQPAQALSKVEVSKVAQSITVMIQNAQNPQDSGSGIIIKREGETYTVLTAHHVVEKSPAYKVMTPDKKLYSIVQGSIQPLPGVDLALVQFKSAGSYGVAKIGDSAQSPSGSASFVSGFPASNVNAVISKPEYYFTSGEIVANASRPNKEGYALAYSNATFPGMSGGPVLNEQGELIGIHGRGERAKRLQNSQVRSDIAVLKIEFNYAIPINTFLTLAPQVNKTLALRTPSPSVPSTPKADDFFLKAEEQSKAGDWKGAVKNYSQALRLNPNYGDAYIGRGGVRFDLGDKQGTIEDLTQAIRINPNQVKSYSFRGNTRLRLGDREGANADYKLALKVNINPEDYEDYIGRGIANKGLGNYKGAIADYDQAIRIDPKLALAYANRGDARNALGDKKGAISDYQKAAALYKAQGDEKSYQNVLKALQRINGR